MRKRIGILGGTFDPVHNGHMLAARAAAEQFELDQMRIMTGGMPPHKKDAAITPAAMRHEMVALAAADEPLFMADDFEVSKRTYTYTSETIAALRALHPDWDIFFLIGADSLQSIMTWHEPKCIAANCRLLVYPRNCGAAELDALVCGKSRELGAKIQAVNAPLFDISSTEIRRRVREGRSIRYLVPDSVMRYIRENKLYTGDSNEH